MTDLIIFFSLAACAVLVVALLTVILITLLLIALWRALQNYRAERSIAWRAKKG